MAEAEGSRERGQLAPGEQAATAPPRPRAAVPLARMLRAQTAIELRLMLRRGESLLVTLVVPVLLLVFFAAVDVLPAGMGVGPGDGSPGVPLLSPAARLLAGILALAVMSTAWRHGHRTGFERSTEC